MEHIPSVGIQLYENGWKQGVYIACSELSEVLRSACWPSNQGLVNDLAKQLSAPRNVLILLSQACDIAARQDALEPVLEFVIASKLKKDSDHHPLNLDAQSSRYLELKLDGNWYKAKASTILNIPKCVLLEQGSSLQLSQINDQDVEVLARWRANRYMRKALPDAFMSKITPLIKNGLFDEGLDAAGGLYLQLEPFAEAEQYRVRLFALHRQGSPIESFDVLFNKMEAILEAINEIEGLSCPFIEGEEDPSFEAVSPAMRRYEVSIALRDHFVRWNFDYISLKANDSSGIDEN